MVSLAEMREEFEITDPDTPAILYNIADVGMHDADIKVWLEKVADELAVISPLLGIAQAAGLAKCVDPELDDAGDDGQSCLTCLEGWPCSGQRLRLALSRLQAVVVAPADAESRVGP